MSVAEKAIAAYVALVRAEREAKKRERDELRRCPACGKYHP